MQFLWKLARIGGDLRSKGILCAKSIRNSYRLILPPQNAYSCRVKVGKRSALVHFSGTMGEIHTLVDIFADDNYTPKHNHSEILFQRNIKSLLDLGANIGLASVWFALLYPGIKIDAYEPNPDMFALLEKNLSQFPNVRVFREAISGRDGTVSFNRSAYSLESSIYEARNSESIYVASTSLNTALRRIGGSVDLMKIDIEGAEFDALKECTHLAGVQAITGEAHTEQSGHAEHKLLDLLSSFNIVEIYNPNNVAVFGFYAARTKSI
jgi:FkbM family methyltransferase